MAIIYTWNVNIVDAYPTKTDKNGNSQSDVICNVHWRLTGNDGTNQKDVYGNQSLDVSDLSNFIDIQSITLENVESWVLAELGEEKIQSLKDNIATQINEVVNPTTVRKIIT
jgi:hypothetical protein